MGEKKPNNNKTTKLLVSFLLFQKEASILHEILF